MKKLAFALSLIFACLCLNAQEFAPYQKGEAMIGIRNPYYKSFQSFNWDEAQEYGFELDINAFLADNWSIGAGSSFSRMSQNDGVDYRLLGFQTFTRYYAPSIMLGPTHLNFYGELRADSYRYYSEVEPRDIASYSSRFYAGLGLAWRPLKFISFDCTLQRAWQRLSDPSGAQIQAGGIWNASFGLNVHWRNKRSAKQ
ncbi:MAG: hypothetical protein AAFN10_21040 [Bacteroidota bacterium]